MTRILLALNCILLVAGISLTVGFYKLDAGWMPYIAAAITAVVVSEIFTLARRV